MFAKIMFIFRLLYLERMLIWQKKIWKSVIYHSIKLPFNAEVAEKILNVIYSRCCGWRTCSHICSVGWMDSKTQVFIFKFTLILSRFLNRLQLEMNRTKVLSILYSWKVQKNIAFLYLYFTHLCPSWNDQRILKK